MAAIQVTSEELHSVAGHLSTGAGTVHGQLGSLRAQVDGLVGAGWKGGASAQFHDLYTQWNTAGQQLLEALTGISKALETSANNYEQAEQTNISNFSK